MIKMVRTIIVVAILTSLLASCQAEVRYKHFKIGFASQKRWPVLVFWSSENLTKGSSDDFLTNAVSGGWDGPNIGFEVWNFRRSPDSGSLHFKVRWIELATRSVYEADVSVPLAELSHDVVEKQEALVAIRITTRGGYEVVTPEQPVFGQSSPSPMSVILSGCGRLSKLTDRERPRLTYYTTEPIFAVSSAKQADTETIPSHCK